MYKCRTCLKSNDEYRLDESISLIGGEFWFGMKSFNVETDLKEEWSWCTPACLAAWIADSINH